MQPQQQQPVLAVAFMSPPERCIKEGLPTIKRCGISDLSIVG
jgi:hypothetical protein